MHPRSQGARVETQNSYSAPPALDAPVGFRQDFEDMISFDFSGSLKSCIAPRFRNHACRNKQGSDTESNTLKRGSCHYMPPPEGFDMKDKSNLWIFFRLVLLEILYGGETSKNQDLRKQSLRSRDCLSLGPLALDSKELCTLL